MSTPPSASQWRIAAASSTARAPRRIAQRARVHGDGEHGVARDHARGAVGRARGRGRRHDGARRSGGETGRWGRAGVPRAYES